MNLDKNELKVLLVEDNDSDAGLIKQMLNNEQLINFKVDHIKDLTETLKIIDKHRYDIILFNIGFLDSDKLEYQKELTQTYSIGTPIILLSNVEKEGFAFEALRSGAQDYLLKKQISAKSLIQAIKYAIERNKLLKTLKENSLIDELTGLYNRRGFYNLSEKQVKRALRLNSDFLIFYADIDGLKRINDKYGHHEGDRVIRDMAIILKESFRQSDIISRIGGDEFVILALDTSYDSIKVIRKRMEKILKNYNQENKKPYSIFISMGATVFSANKPSTVKELIEIADQNMYQIKMMNKGNLGIGR
ncbi:GGDEF domain-containing protein [Natronospora cellulosivora (SeqCode)]